MMAAITAGLAILQRLSSPLLRLRAKIRNDPDPKATVIAYGERQTLFTDPQGLTYANAQLHVFRPPSSFVNAYIARNNVYGQTYWKGEQGWSTNDLEAQFLLPKRRRPYKGSLRATIVLVDPRGRKNRLRVKFRRR